MECDETAILVEGKLGIMELVARVGSGREAFSSRFDPLDRHAESHGSKAHQHLIRVQMFLASETTADMGSNDAHLTDPELQYVGEMVANVMGRLRRRPDRQLLRGAVPPGNQPAGLDWGPALSRDTEPHGDDPGSPVNSFQDSGARHAKVRLDRDVGAPSRVEQWTAGSGSVVCVHHCGERVDVDVDEAEQILSCARGACDNETQRLADISRLVIWNHRIV